ncbi:geranylgeranylglycerol-phosphate geranylgeranyltransferase [Methanoplanus limicola]|uniref:Digeranylgeranylglyceryl phosphate synthase n=1 Tax=Methanoplanus limicola DSM 2279 TaxID=937775 RepID=H1Z2D7_9EURY|nr:geranylgeranylglycerol-phosphate geranylgeranyltransferase [Methanoplanus limicola]EHQ34666.1 Digeranylgeranylglyceryl phosphate synthase [Methanoplanus limicola DSM 2279]
MNRGYIKITRPVNSLFAGFAVLLGIIIAKGTIPGDSPAEYLILIPVVAMITAAGNVINDYYDREIDAVNRPERPIPSGSVSPKGALLYSAVLFAAGISISFFAGFLCLIIASVNSLLLVLYAMKLKGVPFAGNISVSYLSASIFLFGGALYGLSGLINNFPVALITFFAILSREILKDAEDVEGDRAGGVKTLPMYTGIYKSSVLAFVFALIAVIISLMPVFRWWGLYYILLILVADAVIMAGAVKGVMSGDDSGTLKRSGATGILKNGMFLAVVIFILSALLIG